MNVARIEQALRAADPAAEDHPVPAVADAVRAARHRAAATPPARAQAIRTRRIALTAIAACIIGAGAVAVPIVSARHSAPAAAISLVAYAPPQSLDLPFGVAVAPAGWGIEGAKSLGGNDFLVTIGPAGRGPVDDDAISVARYSTPRPPFPDGYEGPGPVSATTSEGRPTSIMRGQLTWLAQVFLDDGGVFYVLMPLQMTEDQVHAFLDGLSAAPAR